MQRSNCGRAVQGSQPSQGLSAASRAAREKAEEEGRALDSQ